ncbi:MAG: type II toxin-antitoxin system VapC family toxin [Myxococcales bacterium]
MKVFVDSNVPMYVAGREHPLREPARRFMARVSAGEIEAVTSTEVLQEILYRYVGLRRPDLADSVYALFVQLCTAVLPVTLADTDRAKALCSAAKGARVGVRDAVHAAVMLNADLTRIATFDEGFDHVRGLDRLRLD